MEPDPGQRQISNTYGPKRRARTTSSQVCGQGSQNHRVAVRQRHLPGHRVDQLGHCPTGRLESSDIGGVHVARGYRKLPEKNRQNSSRTLSSAASTGRGKCKSTSNAARHFLGESNARSKCAGRVEAQAVE